MDFSSLGFVRVAAIAPPVSLGDPNANRVKIAAWAQEFADAGASVIVFPELSLTGYTCEDLFLTSMVQRAHMAIAELAAATASLNATIVVGAPLQAANGRRYNAAVVIHHGQVLGAVPKIHLPNYGEFYERRWFTPGADVDEMITIGGLEPFRLHARQVFDLGTAGGVVVRMGVEICEDLWAPDQPSSALALAGANLIVNPSASNELIAKSDYRRDLVRIQSARLSCAYVYAGSGPSESTKDVVFGGHCLVAENGSILAESDRFEWTGSSVIVDIDIERLANERALNTTFGNAPEPFPAFAVSKVAVSTSEHGITPMPPLPTLRRTYARLPFVPDNPATINERAKEILAIQSTGLARRMMAARSERAVLGLSGGLDSTLALLVVLETMKYLSRGPESILCVSMPGLGTTDRTKVSAAELARCAGVEFREIPIAAAVNQHFSDIGHDPRTFDVVYENSQARERTQILFDIANQVKGIVVGTGDLSELALGWCTYNADHMANYGVNGSVPKTLVKHLVRWYGDNCGDDAMNAVLDRILDTIISPELLPAGAKGEIVQSTEDIVGPYELHDFFLYHRQRNGFGPAKIRALAIHTFNEASENPYDEATINKWIRVFFERFARQQFKRTTLPPGPKVGSVSLSPRGDLRMPDEIDPTAWLAELD